MWGGELFVPKISSYKIVDVAKAISPNCKIKIIGLRPGEKIHEEMITVSDSGNTLEFNDYYVIMPSTIEFMSWKLPDFIKNSGKSPAKFCTENFSYDSLNNKDFLNAYITIQKICNRNKEKEILINSARPVLKALAPQTPMEIADLLARELLVTESGAETLRRVGDLI